jgi:hypothetical protein
MGISHPSALDFVPIHRRSKFARFTVEIDESRHEQIEASATDVV